MENSAFSLLLFVLAAIGVAGGFPYLGRLLEGARSNRGGGGDAGKALRGESSTAFGDEPSSSEPVGEEVDGSERPVDMKFGEGGSRSMRHLVPMGVVLLAVHLVLLMLFPWFVALGRGRLNSTGFWSGWCFVVLPFVGIFYWWRERGRVGSSEHLSREPADPVPASSREAPS